MLIPPGKPTQNAYIERFNGEFRDERLNQNAFVSFEPAKAVISTWRRDDNEVRPHRSLGKLTPSAFATQLCDLGSLRIHPSDKIATQDSTY